jgi:hypothetical protein
MNWKGYGRTQLWNNSKVLIGHLGMLRRILGPRRDEVT